MVLLLAHESWCNSDHNLNRTVFYFTPSKKLIFCAVTSVIALALHDEAFDGSSLVTATSILRDAKISGQMQSIPLRWKQSRLKCPVFRQIQRGVLSDDKAMPYSKLNYDMGRQSLDAGFEKAWTPRFARRGAANAADGEFLVSSYDSGCLGVSQTFAIFIILRFAYTILLQAMLQIRYAIS